MKEVQHSYGIVPLRQVDGTWQVFLVQHVEGHWALPKGKKNRGETPLTAATRELFEETGLQIKRLLSSQSFEDHYHFRRGSKSIYKTVTYFVAEVEGKETLQQTEIQNGGWFDCDQAYNRVTYPQTGELLTKVVALLKD